MKSPLVLNTVAFLFQNTWPWWLAGLLIGLTALGLAWVTGRRLGVSSAYADACDLKKGVCPSWKVLFVIGLPLGALVAHLSDWGWTFVYGRLDALCLGSSALKILLLFMGGLLLGFGARWAGGCVSAHTLMGIGMRSKMSILVTVVFFAVAAVMAQLLIRGM